MLDSADGVPTVALDWRTHAFGSQHGIEVRAPATPRSEDRRSGGHKARERGTRHRGWRALEVGSGHTTQTPGYHTVSSTAKRSFPRFCFFLRSDAVRIRTGATSAPGTISNNPNVHRGAASGCVSAARAPPCDREHPPQGRAAPPTACFGSGRRAHCRQRRAFDSDTRCASRRTRGLVRPTAPAGSVLAARRTTQQGPDIRGQRRGDPCSPPPMPSSIAGAGMRGGYGTSSSSSTTTPVPLRVAHNPGAPRQGGPGRRKGQKIGRWARGHGPASSLRFEIRGRASGRFDPRALLSPHEVDCKAQAQRKETATSQFGRERTPRVVAMRPRPPQEEQEAREEPNVRDTFPRGGLIAGE